jgi:hypothetical protein
MRYAKKPTFDQLFLRLKLQGVIPPKTDYKSKKRHPENESGALPLYVLLSSNVPGKLYFLLDLHHVGKPQA